VGVVKSLETKKRVAGQFAVKYKNEASCWTHSLNKEDYGVDKYGYFLLSKNNKHCCVSLRYSVQSETPYDFFYRPTIFKARPGDYIITLMCITDM
jgi:hypothetical protein